MTKNEQDYCKGNIFKSFHYWRRFFQALSETNTLIILHDHVNTVSTHLSQLSLHKQHRPNKKCSSLDRKDLPHFLPVAGLILAAIWKWQSAFAWGGMFLWTSWGSCWCGAYPVCATTAPDLLLPRRKCLRFNCMKNKVSFLIPSKKKKSRFHL